MSSTHEKGDSDSRSVSDEKLPIDNASAEYVHGKFAEFDVGLALVAGHADEPTLTQEEWKKLRRKIDWHLLPLLCAIYTLQFIDKNTLASSSILGIITDNNLTTNEFNNLSSAFYIGYLIFVGPQNLALQRFPVGKWITFNIFLWSLFLGLHAVCHNYGSLFALRFLLGAAESCMTSGLMLVTGMFYTRVELAERIGWTFQCNGLAVIIAGFISFGVYHANPNGHPNQWQWFMIVTCLMTFVCFVCFLLFFPDNSTSAWFLTEKERRAVVRRVQENKNGIETKTWKRKQAIEAFLDPKTYLFFFFGGFAATQGGIGVQYSIIIKGFGFTTLQTTLLNIPSGFAQIIGITLGGVCLRFFPNSRCWIGALWWIPSIASCFMQIFIPFHNQTAHLVALYLLYLGSSPAFIMMLSWVTSNVSGHTKRMTTSSIFLVGYSLGQILCSQFWKKKYQPRDIVPWSITLMSYCCGIICMLILEYLFVTENKRRNALRAQAEASGDLGEFDEYAYIDVTDENGNEVKSRVEKTLLDLTDKENLNFRYAT